MNWPQKLHDTFANVERLLTIGTENVLCQIANEGRWKLQVAAFRRSIGTDRRRRETFVMDACGRQVPVVAELSDFEMNEVALFVHQVATQATFRVSKMYQFRDHPECVIYFIQPDYQFWKPLPEVKNENAA